MISLIHGDEPWKKPRQHGAIPSWRDSATFAPISSGLVLFGGFYECVAPNQGPNCQNIYYNDVFLLDTETNAWTHPPTPLIAPPPRAFHGSCPYPTADTILIYGGVNFSADFSSFTFYGDLWEYNPRFNLWILRSLDLGPGPRVGAEIEVLGDIMYLFGGTDATIATAHNDLWAFNLRLNVWTLLKPDTPDGNPLFPDTRSLLEWRLMDVDPTNPRIMLYGGNSGGFVEIQRTDTWVYYINTNSWQQLFSHPGYDTGRTHGASAVYRDSFVVSLGDWVGPNATVCPQVFFEVQGKPTNGTWSIDVPEGQYAELDVRNAPTLKRVANRSKHGRLYVWGGYNFVCPDVIMNTDLYTLDLTLLH